MAGFDDKRIDLVERLRECADIDEMEGATIEVVRMTREAADEIERGRAIEKAARDMFQVRGRYNTQIATCRLGELLGEKVTWPTKTYKCIEAAKVSPNAAITGGESAA